MSAAVSSLPLLDKDLSAHAKFTAAGSSDLYSRMKSQQRQLEFLEIQESTSRMKCKT